MSQKESKDIWVPLPQGGFAKLAFTKVNDHWYCKMDDVFMEDLQSLMSGEERTQPRVKWVDPGIDYGNF